MTPTKFAALAAATAAFVLPGAAMAQNGRAGDRIPEQYICVLKASVARGNVDAEAQRATKAHGGQVMHTYRNAVKGFATRIPAQALTAMQRGNSNIAYCEQDQVVTIDEQPAAKARPSGAVNAAAAQTVPWGITRVNGGTQASSAVAWVIDSGIDLDHPDLNVNVTASRSFVRDRSPNDANGHGTHVAGTIAALNNNIGVVGVAPGTQVVAVRVLDRRGSGSTSGVIAGVDYVAANGRPGDVANMSLGGGISTTLDNAVIAAASTGVRFALAAGNESDNANSHSPARANGPNVYTVSAFSQGDNFASFSNFGNPPVDFAEPGVSVLSTYLNGGYATLSGTSMATPHLAGILLLGAVRNGGLVNNDPDGNPDIIGVR